MKHCHEVGVFLQEGEPNLCSSWMSCVHYVFSFEWLCIFLFNRQVFPTFWHLMCRSHISCLHMTSSVPIWCLQMLLSTERTFDSCVTYADECQLPSFARMSLSALIQTSVRKHRYAFASTSTAHARKECSHSTFPFTACILELNFNFDRSGKRKILPLWNRMKPIQYGPVYSKWGFNMEP